ncbi:uncharacterized protein TNCV_1652391 [Trichonephila clavipes]|nr:uncharacterized protein TNCV_1652391 [Trichonephila clavipes]
MRLLITSWGTLSHSSRRALSSSWRVCGGGWRLATRLPRASPTCSIGFMSGEHAGHSNLNDSFLEKGILHETLWLQRLPANLQQVLSVCKAPLDELTQIADKVHEVSGSDLTVARIETKSNQIELDVLKAEIADLKNMVKKLTVSAYSPNRNGYRSRSLTSSRGFDKNKARSKRLCWYHFHFGDKASKCKKPCAHPLN